MPADPPLVAVYGSSTVREGDATYALTRSLGRALAEAGFGVITGGYSGVMEAASRGAHEAGGHVVGVTVELFEKRGPANRFVRERVHTPDLFERLRVITTRARGFIVAPGSVGTLTELFLTWTLLSTDARPAAPLVLLGDHWEDYLARHRGPPLVLESLFPLVHAVRTPEEAVAAVRAGIPASRAAR